nr:single-stranded-DNA-specific exonuclease RecJ [Pseudomarimonas arenosa]
MRRRPAAAEGNWPDSIHPVVRRVLQARGVAHAHDAQLGLRQLLRPQGLLGLDPAIALLRRAIEQGWSILVVGDFDCDGATGTAVAVRGLRMLGANSVDFRVPHRMRHGYGLSPALVAELQDPLPDLLITVDNGVSSIAGVAAAKARGIRVLVTDHHLPGEQLPEADAMVNPNLDGDQFPSKSLAGVGVMFYVLLALRADLRQAGYFPSGEPDLAQLLDLVALGTVADLVQLDQNNRVLVSAGLSRIRRGLCAPGIRALIDISGRQIERLTATDFAFALGPRVNAAGRLEDMSIGIRCLLTDDSHEAVELAHNLHAINAERRDLQTAMIEDEVVEQAVVPVAGQGGHGICVFDRSFHAGVVGLVASKLKERWHRPVVAFAPASEDPDDPQLRGSARSIPGFHLRDALALIDARHPGLIDKFGGHAMAAGLSMTRDRLPAFAAAFEQVAQSTLSPEQLTAELWSDGMLERADFCRPLVEQLAAMGPWGQGFPEPQFDGEFDVLEWRVVGQRHLKMQLRCVDTGVKLSSIHFGAWDGEAPPPRAHFLYQLEADDYRQRGDIQLLIRHRF